jgi:hypothetical protein
MCRDNPISLSTTRQLDGVKNDLESTVQSATSANECSAADALVSEGRSFGAESTDRRRERHVQPGPCHGRTLCPQAVSESELTTPTPGGPPPDHPPPNSTKRDNRNYRG